LISAVLYNVEAIDAGALAASGALIVLLVAISAVVPAWQAGAINPSSVLRGA
jgi:ABC-type lipoprotein release transport system permease subunit